MNYLERKQIAYLKTQKDILIDNFIGACEAINDQIDDVKSGLWLKELQSQTGKSEKEICEIMKYKHKGDIK